MRTNRQASIAVVVIAMFMQAAVADTASTADIPDGQVAIPPVQAPLENPPQLKTVEIRNNSKVEVFVVQKGAKTSLLPKNTSVMDISQYPVSITPADGKSLLKYVTLSGKLGACKTDLCLIVQ